MCELCSKFGTGLVAFLHPETAGDGGGGSGSGAAGEGKPSFTASEAAQQLFLFVNKYIPDSPTYEGGGNWIEGYGSPISMTYGFRAFEPTGNLVNGFWDDYLDLPIGNFQRMNAQQIEITELALQLWSEAANLTFTREGTAEINDIQYAEFEEVDFIFQNYTNNYRGGFGNFSFWDNGGGDVDRHSEVWINSNGSYWKNPSIQNYSIVLILHEVAHGLGFYHPGAYNTANVTYENAAEYLEDSRQYTVMSYFAETKTGANFGGLFPMTPMLHDIFAMQMLYGANMSTRDTATVYGFNSNTGSEIYGITKSSDRRVYSIWDGGGEDTLDFSLYTSNNNINLGQGEFSSVGGLKYNISIAFGAEIENAIGGTTNDKITGNELDNELQGMGGNDTLEGKEGNDILDGGSGNDAASYENAIAGVTIDLLLGTTASVGYDVGTDSFISIERLIGGAFDDELTGDNLDNKLEGGNGDDTLEGGDGSDGLYGGDHDAGGDTASYEDAAAAVTVSLATTSGQNTVGAGKDLLSGIENLTGSEFADRLTGDKNANVVDGGKGSDLLIASFGNDTLLGATGQDTVSYALFTAPVTVDLGAGTAGYLNGKTAEQHTLLSIQHIIGSAKNDTIAGDTGGNIIEGGAGNDNLDGGTVDADTVSYASSTAAVTVDLLLVGPQNTKGAGIDTLANFENILGGKGADVLSGDGNENVIDGGANNDALSGAGGNDTLEGGDGNDILAGGEGDDTLTGGAGNDRFDYDAKGKDTVADFAAGLAKTDTIRIANTFTNFAELMGAAADVGADTVIDFGGGLDTLTIAGVLVAEFHENDFIFNKAPTITSNGGGANAAVKVNENAITVATVKASDPDKDKLVYSISGGADAALFEIDATKGTLKFKIGPDFEDPDDVGADNIYEVIVSASDGGFEDTQTIEVSVKNLTKETITGTDNDDFFVATSDQEAFMGLLGTDAVSYENAKVGVTVSLSGASKDLGFAKGDTFNSIENLVGSASNDVLTGDKFDNVLTGDKGDDLLDGGLGDDTLDGGDGNDTVSYATATKAVLVNLNNVNVKTDTLGAGEDTWIGIENAIGSKFHDNLTGNNDDNVIEGGLGNDKMDGQGGNDTLSYESVTAVVTVDLNIVGIDQNTKGAGIDDIQGFENIVGGKGADALTGDDNANILTGGAGNDTLSGNGDNDQLRGEDGNDTLIGGAGADKHLGGDGTDTASYAAAGAGIIVNLMLGSGTFGEALGDTFDNIENLIGSAFNDELYGDDGANKLEGGEGNDFIEGFGGNDVLDADGGTDALSFSYLGLGVTLTLGAYNTKAGASAATKTSGVAGDIDTVSNFENVVGSGFADKFVGNAGANELAGSGGHDVLEGAAGDDLLFGDDGDDILNGSDGNDLLHGSSGNDTANYATVSKAVLVNLNNENIPTDTQGAGTDTWIDIESIIGSKFNDNLTGNGDDNVIEGGLGNDMMDGQGGSNDTASYASATAGVTVDLNIAGIDQNTKGGGIDNIQGFENLTGGKGADLLTGDGNDNVLTGSAGNDKLIGGAGGDDLIGGDGIDTADYTGSATGVFANLATNFVALGDATGDSLDGIENLIGGAGNDEFHGDDNANRLESGGGGDFLEGGDGNDFIDGGEGTDTLYYFYLTSGITLKLGSYNTKTGTSAAAKTSGVAGDIDTIMNIEDIAAGDGDDVITGNAAANVFNGNMGNDTLDGGDGDDQLFGGGNDDVLTGGNGDDVLNGGTESDTASYASASKAVLVNLNNENIKTDTQGAGEDTWIDIENIVGSKFHDNLSGNDGDNVIEGGLGNDMMDGNIGTDTASYASATAGVTVDLNITGAAQNTKGGGIDTLDGFENLTGGKGADLLTGDGNGNVLTGGAGNDKLLGGGGDDLLLGELGMDTLTGDAGADTFYIKWGEGADTIADFVLGEDEIDLELTASIDEPLGYVEASGAGIPAHTGADPAIVYDLDNGRLYYDSGPGAPIQIATLTGAPALDFSAFNFV